MGLGLVLLALRLGRARLEPVRVAGSSMAPTLPEGTLLAAGPVTGPLGRGRLVLVRRPPGWDQAEPMELVKRIVGLPGEHVRLTGARLEVDGRPVPEPYLAPGPRDPVPFEILLGPGQYLVLGDRRAKSTDGRSFGPIGRHDVIGIVRFVYWPPAAWRTNRVIKRLGNLSVSPDVKLTGVTRIGRRQPK